MTNNLQITLFGHPQILLDQHPIEQEIPLKGQALIYYLATLAQPVARESAATLLWPDVSTRTARQSLRSLLVTLRKRLAPFMEATLQTVALRTEQIETIDVLHFLKNLNPPGIKIESSQVSDLQIWQAGLDQYRGDFLDGFTIPDCVEFEEWVLIQREDLRQRMIANSLYLADAYSATSLFALGVDCLARLLAIEPWSEAAYLKQMELLAKLGRRSEAIHQYERCQVILREEFGLEPSPELTTLYSQIRAAEIDVVSSTSTAIEGEEKREGQRQTRSNQAQGIMDVEGDHRQTEPPPEQRQFSTAESAYGYSTVVASSSGFDPPTNIPVPITPLIGREDELAFIHQRLAHDSCRLLTIVGPGGIGKTRLAQEAARQLWQESTDNGFYADGVYFVELVGIKPTMAEASSEEENDGKGIPMGESIIQAILDVLDIPLSNQARPMDQLARTLNRRKVLLLLDNIEHLVDGVNTLSELLTSASGVTLLVTSRVQLALYGEQSLFLNGLPCSLPNYSDSSISKLEIIPAAERLFIQQAQLVDRYFLSAVSDSAIKTLSESDRKTLEQVTRICQLIDGIPLAIEMAASWISLFDCSTIVAELESGNELLQSQQRNTPLRHQSMQVVFDTSWQLLSGDDQEILLRLSFFQGSFSYAAVQQVGKATLIQVSALMGSSWLWQINDKRYQMHELVRQYLAEKRMANEVLDSAVQRDHACYFGQWLAQAPTDSMGCADNNLLHDMDLEQSNLDQAWQWALSHEQAEIIEQLSEGMRFYHFYRGTFQRGEGLFTQALNGLSHVFKEEGHDSLHGKLLIARGYLLLPQARLEQARELIYQALDLFDEQSNAWHCAIAYLILHEIATRSGNQELPAVSLHELCDTFRRLEDQVREAQCWGLIGSGEAYTSNYRSGRLSLLKALELSHQTQELNYEANNLYHLGVWAYRERHLDRAVEYLTRASDLANKRKLMHNEIAIRQALMDAQILAGQLGDVRHSIAKINKIVTEIDSSTGRFAIAYIQAVLHLQARQYDNALNQIRQALTEKESANTDIHDLCKMYFVLGTIYSRNALWDEAREALTKLQTIASDANDTAYKMSALAGFAEIDLDHGEQAQAVAHVKSILALLPQSHLNQSSVPDYQYVYLICIRVLLTIEDGRAKNLLTDAYTHLQNQAAQIQDPEIRHSFLANVPSNATIVELFKDAQR
ncbi:MAG: BTAD domain-containing putative transcriptional regulator [Chloroflexota bacterium]